MTGYLCKIYTKCSKLCSVMHIFMYKIFVMCKALDSLMAYGILRIQYCILCKFWFYY